MGRRVFVTGGTGALGSAVTQRLLEDGHRVAVTCRRGAEVDALRAGLGDLGANLAVIAADVTDEESVDAALAQFHSRIGSVEALVHLVGAWHGGEPVQEQSLETWRGVTDLNLTSAFLCAHAVLPERSTGAGAGWSWCRVAPRGKAATASPPTPSPRRGSRRWRR